MKVIAELVNGFMGLLDGAAGAGSRKVEFGVLGMVGVALSDGQQALAFALGTGLIVLGIGISDRAASN